MFICLSGWINRHLVSDTNGRKGEKSRNEYKEWGGEIETETDRQTDRQTEQRRIIGRQWTVSTFRVSVNDEVGDKWMDQGGRLVE